MKRKPRIIPILSIAAAGAVFSFGSPYISDKLIGIPECGKGLFPFTEVQIIQTMDELKEYVSKYETTPSELSELPDFEKELAFGLVTGYCNDHHTSYSRNPEGAVLRNDTVYLIVHTGRSVDSTQVLPLGFCGMLITVERSKLKSGTPIRVRLIDQDGNVTAAQTPRTARAPQPAEKAVKGRYDILGRIIDNHIGRSNGVVVVPRETGGTLRVFTGGAHSGERR
jgi:hypothetical protein